MADTVMSLADAHSIGSDSELGGGGSESESESEGEGEGSGGDDAMSAVEVEESDVLPLHVSRLAPADVGAQAYVTRFVGLGNNRLHPREVCGGTLEGMLDMLREIRDRLFSTDEEEVGTTGPPTPISKYKHACSIFGVNPDGITPPARIQQLMEHTTIRLMRLHTAIEEELELTRTAMEDTRVGHAIAEAPGERNSVRDDARVIFIAIMKALQASAELMKVMVQSYAALTPTSNITAPFPMSAFTLMHLHDDARSLSPNLHVERNLLWALYRGDFRRMGDMVMQPHTVATPSSRVVHTNTYRFRSTIEEFVQKHTSLTANFDQWQNRGRPEFITANLKSADTYLFPPLNVQQGVYSCRDAILDLNTLQFFLFDATDPHAVTLLRARDAAVAAMEARMQRHHAALRANQALEDAAAAAVRELAEGALEGSQSQVRLQREMQARQRRDHDAMRARGEVPTGSSDMPLPTAALVPLLVQNLTQERQEREACISDMAQTTTFLNTLLTTDRAPSTLVAEMFVDMHLPWAALLRFLEPQVRTISFGGAKPLTEGKLVLEWRRMETKSWQYLFEYQELPPDAIDWAAYIMTGRMIFPPNRFESWQVIYEEIGWSNTGKSLKCKFIEMLHREPGAPVTRTGILSNNIEEKFGPSEVLGGSQEENSVFACVHRDVDTKFGRNFPTGSLLVWAANEENPWPVKNKAPIIRAAPHTSVYGNQGLPQVDTNDNVNRRRVTVRNNVPVKKVNTQLESRVQGERLTIILKSAIAYRDKAHEVWGEGIWNTGVLPTYFHEMKEVNRMANQPLVAFLRSCDGEIIQLDKTALEAASSNRARAEAAHAAARQAAPPSLVAAMDGVAAAQHALGALSSTAAFAERQALTAALRDAEDVLATEQAEHKEEASSVTRAEDELGHTRAVLDKVSETTSFLSLRRVRHHVDEYINNNRHIRSMDWTNLTQIKQTLMRFGCELITPSTLNETDLPTGLRRSVRGKWVIGMGEVDVLQQDGPVEGAAARESMV